MPKFRVGQGVSTSGGVGMVMDITHSLPEPTYRVFLNGRSEPFYEGQLTAADLDTSPALVDAEAFRCQLAALNLTSPSGDAALSLNEGRIDHIPYQYRPVLRLPRLSRHLAEVSVEIIALYHLK
jgi:hypothetical protein